MLTFRMLPPVALVLPYYFVFRQAGLLGSLWAIGLTHAVFSIAIVIWMMKAYFETLPREIEEAARIDGASTWQVFTRIALPLSHAAVAAAAIFSFLTSWNEFLFAVILSRPQTQTVPVAVASFVGEVYVSWGELAAATVLGLLPALALVFVSQRFLLVGIAPGGVK
jgi:multiple sugar transport system permease protein